METEEQKGVDGTYMYWLLNIVSLFLNVMIVYAVMNQIVLSHLQTLLGISFFEAGKLLVSSLAIRGTKISIPVTTEIHTSVALFDTVVRVFTVGLYLV